MNEHWDKLITECLILSQTTGVPMPGTLLSEVGATVGRIQADIWLREASMLQALVEFLDKVNKTLEDKGAVTTQKRGK